MAQGKYIKEGLKTQNSKRLEITVVNSSGGRIGLELNGNNRVRDVVAGSPAEADGLRIFDRVLSINERPTDGVNALALIPGDAQELRFVVDRPPKWQYQGIAASERDSPSSFEGEPLIVRAEPPAAAPPEVAAPSTKARMDSVSTTPKAMSDLI